MLLPSDPNTSSKAELIALKQQATEKGLHSVAKMFDPWIEAAPEYKRIQLQGIGYKPCKPANQLKPGDILIYNYGYKYTLVRIDRESPAFYFITEKDDKSGKTYERKIKKDRLVACTKESL